jgi:hypothetical protein
MTQNRWHVPMTTDLDKLEDFGNDLAAMGELDGDHPPKPDRAEDEVGVNTLEEVQEYYGQHRPEDITILKPEENK